MFLEIIYGFVSLREGCLGWCWNFIINISKECLHAGDLYSRGRDTAFWGLAWCNSFSQAMLLFFACFPDPELLECCRHSTTRANRHCCNPCSSVCDGWPETECHWAFWNWAGFENDKGGCSLHAHWIRARACAQAFCLHNTQPAFSLHNKPMDRVLLLSTLLYPKLKGGGAGIWMKEVCSHHPWCPQNSLCHPYGNIYRHGDMLTFPLQTNILRETFCDYGNGLCQNCPIQWPPATDG